MNKFAKIDPKKLKKIRIHAGLSMYALAVRLRAYIPTASRTSILGWESGAHQPSVSAVFALSKIFGKPVEEFMR